MLKDKEDKIFKSKEQLHRAKEDAIKEYRNCDTLLYELGGSFADCLRQVKVSFSDLNLSHISIDTQAQTPAHPADQEDTDELFADDTTPSLQDDGETAPPEDQVKPVKDEARPLGRNQMAKERDGETPTDPQ